MGYWCSGIFVHGSPHLVSASQLREVASGAVEEFEDAKLTYHDWGSKWKAAEHDLMVDLTPADVLVKAAGLAALAMPGRETSPTLLAPGKLGHHQGGISHHKAMTDSLC